MINSLYMLLFLTTSFSFFSFVKQYIVYGLWKSNIQVIKKAIFCHGQFICCPFERVNISHGGMSMLQVKMKFRLKLFKPMLILYFLSLLALIIHELGLETKETVNQPRLKNFNLNLILTYQIRASQSYIIITLLPALLVSLRLSTSTC